MGAVGLIIERIPHKDVSYAYLEIQASNANEFESLREEALKKIPQYAFALAAPAEPKSGKAAAGPEVGPADTAAAPPPSNPVAGAVKEPMHANAPASDAAPAPTSTEGLSPREIARQRMAQKGAV